VSADDLLGTRFFGCLFLSMVNRFISEVMAQLLTLTIEVSLMLVQFILLQTSGFSSLYHFPNERAKRANEELLDPA